MSWYLFDSRVSAATKMMQASWHISRMSQCIESGTYNTHGCYKFMNECNVIYKPLKHWSRATHICISNLNIIGPDNGLSPRRRQAIIWTNAGILLIGPFGTNFSEILIQNWNIFIEEKAFENVVWKMAAILSRPQCVKTLRSTWHWWSSIYWYHGWPRLLTFEQKNLTD